jgi:hypothetical protein
MLRAVIIALLCAAAFGRSWATPLDGAVIVTAREATQSVRAVWWWSQERAYRQQSSFAQTRRDYVCYLRGRRGDPQLFMRQEAAGCFGPPSRPYR